MSAVAPARMRTEGTVGYCAENKENVKTDDSCRTNMWVPLCDTTRDSPLGQYKKFPDIGAVFLSPSRPIKLRRYPCLRLPSQHNFSLSSDHSNLDVRD